MKNCKNCAWYCHADGNCYATEARLSGLVPASKPGANTCGSWTFDGLENWEREACEPCAVRNELSLNGFSTGAAPLMTMAEGPELNINRAKLAPCCAGLEMELA